MFDKDPVAELDERFSSGGASPTGWAEARQELETAEMFWVTTVRPDGRPHVTPLVAVWLDEVLYFCTGPSERKAKNLLQNQNCILTTGCNKMRAGLDLVVEGVAVRVTDDALLQRVADAYEAKYGNEWRFTVRDGTFHQVSESSQDEDADGGLVYEVTPSKAFGFGRGDEYSQTRWRFEGE
jgi:uncharacterized pyridoxamine 5'-phosphate oxidase family protein